jgi:DNA-binding GntR family transcriptional regulator
MKTVSAKLSAAPTLASALVDRLRDDIVQGTLAPGEKLRLEHLAPRYRVGRTPLREACCRLAAEGLVTIEDQRGFRVTPISRADLLDLTRTRQQVESLALRQSLSLGDSRWESDVTTALDRLLRVARRTGKSRALDDAWEEEHAALHRALLGACGSPLLLRFHEQLFGQSERYRRLAEGYGQPERDIDAEHRALVKAALGRDVERACALLTEHIARTSERVLERHPALGDRIAEGASSGFADKTRKRA